MHRFDALLDADKWLEEDADLTWHDVVHPSGAVLRRHLNPVTVRVRGSDATLIAHGRQRAPYDVQLFLDVVEGRKEPTLARLCLTHHHGDDVHWHYEHRPSGEKRVTASHPAGKITAETMLAEVFLPALKIPRQTGWDL
jgi:hypothetical protein